MAPSRSSTYTLTPSRRTYSRNTISSENGAQSEPTSTPAPSAREFRRVIGYHNALGEDASNDDLIAQPDPPTYEVTLFRPMRNGPRPSRRQEEGFEALPGYTCTVSIEGALSMKLEQINPFEVAERPLWNDVYVSLTGPLLRVHALKKPQTVLGNKNTKAPLTCGRLLKAYTLQHAEVGIAADHPKVEMVPKSSFVHMLPEGAIERLQEAEPQLFETVRRHVIRLRLEADQFLLRFESSEDRARWLEKLCAAVDIAPPLDDRTEPKYHTLPRRRRRNNAAMRAALAQALAASLLDQEGGGATLSQTQSGEQRLGRVGEDQDNPIMNTNTMDPDMADIDTGFAITDMPEAPYEDRSTGLSNLFRIFSSGMGAAPAQNGASANGAPLVPTASNSSQPAAVVTAPPQATCVRIPARIYPDAYPKWQPQFLIDPAQQIRYRRHCLPNLLYTSKRANDIIIKDGARWKIDWQHDVLRAYPEIPPTYDDVLFQDLGPQYSNEETTSTTAEKSRMTTLANDEEDNTTARPRLLQRLSSIRRRSIDSNRSSIYDQFVAAGPPTPQSNQRRSMELARPPLTNQPRNTEINRNAVPARSRYSMEIRRPPTWDFSSPAATPSVTTPSMELTQILTSETPAVNELSITPPATPGPLSLNPVTSPLASAPVIPRNWGSPSRPRPSSMYTMPSTRPASIAARPMSMDIARIDEVEEHDRAPSRLAHASLLKPRPVTPVQAPVDFPVRVTMRAPSPVALPKKSRFSLLRRLFSRKDKTSKSTATTPRVGQSVFVSEAPSRTTTARPSTEIPRTKSRPSFDIFRRKPRASAEVTRPSARPSVRPSMDMQRPSFQETELENAGALGASTRVSMEFPTSAFPWRSARGANSNVSTEISRPFAYRAGSSNMVTPVASSRVSTEITRPSFQQSPSSGLQTSHDTPRSQVSRMTSSPLANAPGSARASLDSTRIGTTVGANGSPRKARVRSNDGKEGFWRRRLSRKIESVIRDEPILQPQQQPHDEISSDHNIFHISSNNEAETETTIPTFPQAPGFEIQIPAQSEPQPQVQPTPRQASAPLADVREEEDGDHDQNNTNRDHGNGSGNSSSDSSSSTETEGELDNDIVIVEVDAVAVVARRSGAGTVSHLGGGGGGVRRVGQVPEKGLLAKNIAVEDFAIAPVPALVDTARVGGAGGGLPAIVEVM